MLKTTDSSCTNMVIIESVWAGADWGREGGMMGESGEVVVDPVGEPKFIKGMEAGMDRTLWGSVGGCGGGKRKPKLFDDFERRTD